MVGFSSPFGGSGEDDSGDLFDDPDEFVPENNPTPGKFLDGHAVLTGSDHLEFHRTTREVFEERGVYDMTFGYNLAKLNRDTRHPDAGYRYAIETDGESAVLRAEFTPTTAFCPQSDTLTKGSFRAWNGLDEHHEYDLVRVRVDEMHQRSGEINEELTELEAAYQKTGSVASMGEGRQAGSGSERSPDAPF
jgi:hypothetical protein